MPFWAAVFFIAAWGAFCVIACYLFFTDWR